MSFPAGEMALKAANLAAPTKPTTAAEVLSAMGYINKHRFELFDTNQDGALTADDWLEMSFATYAVFNKQRDGRLTLEDYSQVFTGPVEHPFPGASSRSKEIAKRFRTKDRAAKGYLTIEDFREDAAQNFKLNDVNRDGLVTQAEINEVAGRNKRR